MRLSILAFFPMLIMAAVGAPIEGVNGEDGEDGVSTLPSDSDKHGAIRNAGASRKEEEEFRRLLDEEEKYQAELRECSGR